MAELKEARVPDIGGYDDVPVIELLVAVGDTVKKDQGLVTLESDKATLEVPSSAAGVVKEIKVKLGDTLSEGAVVVVLDAEGAAEAPAKAAAPAPAPAAAAAAPASKPPVTPSHRAPAEPAAPKPALSSGKPADIECEMVVLGSGPGGYTAAFRAADLGLDTVLVERYDTLGGVCLNVGCIPSKALLNATHHLHEVHENFEKMGLMGAHPTVDWQKMQAYKDDVVQGNTKGIEFLFKKNKVEYVKGRGKIAGMTTLSLIGFDADDTLWQNEAFFRLTQQRFETLLADFAEPDHLHDRLLAAERRNIGAYGFGVKGFVLSMIETAIEVTDARVPASVIAELVAAGREMLAHPIELLPHAREAVERAAEAHRVVLITKGDLLDQERKLAQSGLGDLFHGVEIVSDKTAPVYATIFARHGDGAALPWGWSGGGWRWRWWWG